MKKDAVLTRFNPRSSALISVPFFRRSDNMNTNDNLLTVGLAQMAPVWLDRERTVAKAAGFMEQAAEAGCQLVVFGEALIPGYPFWIERTDGARFNSPVQKEMHALYMDQAVQIEAGHLQPLTDLAATRQGGSKQQCRGCARGVWPLQSSAYRRLRSGRAAAFSESRCAAGDCSQGSASW